MWGRGKLNEEKLHRHTLAPMCPADERPCCVGRVIHAREKGGGSTGARGQCSWSTMWVHTRDMCSHSWSNTVPLVPHGRIPLGLYRHWFQLTGARKTHTHRQAREERRWSTESEWTGKQTGRHSDRVRQGSEMRQRNKGSGFHITGAQTTIYLLAPPDYATCTLISVSASMIR